MKFAFRTEKMLIAGAVVAITLSSAAAASGAVDTKQRLRQQQEGLSHDRYRLL